MASSRMVQLLCKKLVKPSSPTPNPLRHYRLSLLDQLINAKYSPIALFYPNNNNHGNPNNNNNSNNVSPFPILEKSLSRLLTTYYPFAGRLVGNASIDCNDMGATLLETRINASMSDVLEQPLSSINGTVFPRGVPWNDQREGDSLLVAQLTHFACGGKAIGLCLSHKVGDGNTLVNFLNSWAAITAGYSSVSVVSPEFVGPSLYPPINDPSFKPVYLPGGSEHDVTSRRLVFNGAKIKHLKAAVSAEFSLPGSEESVYNPSKFEVVTALLTISSMAASFTTKLNPFKPLFVGFLVNLRPLTTPPLASSTVGNILSISAIQIGNEGELKLAKVVRKLRQKKVEIQHKYKAMKQHELVVAAHEEKEMYKEAVELGFDVYIFSSLCNYPVYDLDFGWGKPTRVHIAPFQPNKSFIMTDDFNGDGVEAMVSLDKQAMSVFESDPQIHAFACFDPTTRDY